MIIIPIGYNSDGWVIPHSNEDNIHKNGHFHENNSINTETKPAGYLVYGKLSGNM